MGNKKVCILTSVHPVFDTRIFHKEAKSLVKAGYEVTLIAQHTKNETVDGVRIIALPKPRNRFFRMFGTTWKVFSLALGQKADIYHFHDPELLSIGVALKVITKKAIIYDVHEHYAKDILGKDWIPARFRILLKKLFEFQERLFMPFVDYVIYTTPLVGERYNKMLTRTTSIENFPLKDMYKGLQLTFKKKGNKVLYLGLKEKVRGILELIEAMSIVIHQYKREAQLYLVGPIIPTGFQYEIQNLVKKLQMVKYVKLLSPVPFQKTKELLLESSIGVVTFLPYPNHLSSLPNKLFEYMAAGLPVIASDFPLYREIVQGTDCGILVNPEDSKEIALAINNLLLNFEVGKKMGQNGRKAILTKYNWDTEASKLLEIYSNILSP